MSFNLTLDLIAEYLTDLNFSLVNTENIVILPVHSFSPLAPGRDANPLTLYLYRSAEEYSENIIQKIPGIMIIDSNVKPPNGFSGVCVTDSTDNELIEAINQLFTRHYNCLSQLMELYAIPGNKSSYKKMLSLCEAMLDNPVAVSDASLEILFHTKDDAIRDVDWQKSMALGHPDINYIKEYQENQYYEKLAIHDKPFIITPRDEHLTRRLFGKICSGNKIIGTISVPENNHPLNTYDIFLAYHIGQALSIKLQTSTIAVDSQNIPNSLIINLLQSAPEFPDMAKERLRVMNWPESEKYYVLSIDFNYFDYNTKWYSSLSRVLRNLTSTDTIYSFGRYYVAIIRKAAHEQLNTQSFSQLIAFLKEHQLYAGVSFAFDDITQLHYYFKQSTKAIELGTKHFEKQTLYFYEDLTLQHLLSVCAGKMDLQNLCHPLLNELNVYDASKDTDYLHCLHAFIMTNRNTRAAAIALHMHRNTMYYRIDRLKELFHIDLDDDKLITNLYFSFRIYEYLQIIKPI